MATADSFNLIQPVVEERAPRLTLILPGRRHGLVGKSLTPSGRKSRIVWSVDQKVAVMTLCAPFCALLKQKKCDSHTIAAKNAAWVSITEAYNTSNNNSSNNNNNGDSTGIRSAFEIKGVFERVTSSARLKLRAGCQGPNQQLDPAEMIIAKALIDCQDPCIRNQSRGVADAALPTSTPNNNYAAELSQSSIGGSNDSTLTASSTKRRRVEIAEDDCYFEETASSASCSSSAHSTAPSQEGVNDDAAQIISVGRDTKQPVSVEELRSILAEESRLRVKVMKELYENMVRYRRYVEPRLLAVLDRQLALPNTKTVS